MGKDGGDWASGRGVQETTGESIGSLTNILIDDACPHRQIANGYYKGLHGTRWEIRTCDSSGANGGETVEQLDHDGLAQVRMGLNNFADEEDDVDGTSLKCGQRGGIESDPTDKVI